MNIIPRFSFAYGGKPFDVSDAKVTPADYGFLYELSDGLCIELHKCEYREYNAVGWTLWFENKSKTESALIKDVCDCDIAWWFGGERSRVSVFDTAGNLGYETYRHADQIAREFEVTGNVLPRGGALRYHPRGGRSSSYRMPFFDLYTSDRRGLIVAVGWSGQWQASFSHSDGNIIEIKTGLEYTAFKLHPGERIRTSSVILLEYSGTQTQGSNLFRRFVKYELCPYTPDRFPFALEGMGMTTEKHLYHLE